MTKKVNAEDAKLVGLYKKNLYSTVTCNDSLFVLFGTDIKNENIAADISNKGICTIHNRDFANLILAENCKYSASKIESLTDEQVAKQFLSIFQDEQACLVNFTKREPGDLLDNILSKYNGKTRIKIENAMKSFDIQDSAYTIVHTVEQIEGLRKKKHFYARFDIERGRYEVMSPDYIVAYMNRHCGSWNFMLNKENCYTIFFEKVETVSYSENEQLMLETCLHETPYQAANRLIRLEDLYAKKISNLVELATSIKGFIDSSTVYYPSLDVFAEQIAKECRIYNKANKKLSDEQRVTLLNIYKNVNIEIRKAKNTIIALENVLKQGATDDVQC